MEKISTLFPISYGLVIKRKEEHKNKGNGFGYSLFNENSSYVNTISARYYKDGSEILIDQASLGKTLGN